MGGEFNSHVGEDKKDYQIVRGGYDFGDCNEDGQSILDFAMAYDLIVTNTVFKKEEYLITFNSGSNKS